MTRNKKGRLRCYDILKILRSNNYPTRGQYGKIRKVLDLKEKKRK